MRLRRLSAVLAAAALATAALASTAAARPGPFRNGTWLSARNLHQVRGGFVGFAMGRHGLQGFTGRIPSRCAHYHDDGSVDHEEGYELWYDAGARDEGHVRDRALVFSWLDDETSDTHSVRMKMSLDGAGRRARATVKYTWEDRDSQTDRLLVRCRGGWSGRVHWAARREHLRPR
jgi:hypothetical protein